MDAHEVKTRLADQAEAVCQHLLPAGRRRGRQYFVGSLHNEEGDSLVIEIDGAKVGVWADFAAGEKGGSNLLELWRAVRGCDFATACREAREWLGVATDHHAKAFHPKAKASAPAFKPANADFVPLRAQGKVSAYLKQQRGLSESVLDAYRVAETDKGGGYVFPSYSGDGQFLEMWKSVALERNDRGKKITRTSSGTAKCLFGKHAVAEHEGTLVITEGEIDALTVAQVGGYAVSVPYGAKAEKEDGSSPNDAWIEYDWNWLEQFAVIVLCFDADEEGEKATLAVLKRLGRERCRIVEMPAGCKDANDCLVAGRETELADALANARSLDPEELRNATTFAESVWERMHPPNGETPGRKFFLPVAFRVRPGELTVWSGFNGSGKSVLLTNMAVDLASKGERTCIASFEMPPAHTLEIAARQAANAEKIDQRERFEKVMGWLGQSLWIFDRDSVRRWEEMLDVFTYARRRYNIGQFIIDSLLKCGIGSDDYNEQKRFVDTLANWAKREGVHVHLVCHQKKQANENENGGKMGVKGASEITDLAWNVVTITRNKAKEEALWAAINSNDEAANNEAAKMIDGKLAFSKQRVTGDEPWTNLFYDRYTMRFRAEQACRDMPYV